MPKTVSPNPPYPWLPDQWTQTPTLTRLENEIKKKYTMDRLYDLEMQWNIRAFDKKCKEEEDMLLDSLLDKDMNYFLAKGKKSKRKLEEDLSIRIRRKKIKSTKYSCSSGAIWID